MSLWNRYLGYHPEIESRLDILDKLSKERFTRKLKNEKEESNFSSILTELGFFEYFLRKGFKVELEKEYLDNAGSKFTPDLTIEKNGQSIIVEVVRLNPTQKDNTRNKFEAILLEEIEKIQLGCWLQIDFVEQYFDVKNYDIDTIIKELTSWIFKNCQIGSELTISKNFIFKVIKVDSKYSHICVLGNANSIDIDTRRLSSLGSRFIQKVSKYSKLINEILLPYIICIKIDFHAGIDKEEMFWTMYGDLLFYQHHDWYEMKLNGIFYQNDDAKNYLSGVMLMIGDRVHYYHNYGQQRLMESIKSELLVEQYLGDRFNKLIYLRAR